ncbi:MAG: LuxR C-terminal-related transcriptional regulator [Blastocatellia bacterium]
MNSSNENEISVLLADDQELFRAGVRVLISEHHEIFLAGEADSREQTLELAGRLQPGLILLDMWLHGAGSLDFLPELALRSPASRILMLSEDEDEDMQKRAIRLGACGVFLKRQPAQMLLRAIRKAHAGELWLDRAVTTRLLRELVHGANEDQANPERERIASLTEREREVIALVVRGLRNRQIGDELCIAETTVRHHLTSIFGKLGLQDRVGLVIHAYKNQLIGK